ncbi:MAG: hypothetical protein R6V04_03420 [bacterium]
MYALESGHFNDSGSPVYNPFYDPSGLPLNYTIGEVDTEYL